MGKVQVKVVGLQGEEKIVEVSDSEKRMKITTVLELKGIITKKLRIDGDIRLVFRTQPLEDSSLLVYYGIKHMSTIHIVLKLPGGIGFYGPEAK